MDGVASLLFRVVVDQKSPLHLGDTPILIVCDVKTKLGT